MSGDLDIGEDGLPVPVKPKRQRTDWLAPKKRAFCDAYVTDPQHDPVRAYLSAGYRDCSDAGRRARAMLQEKAVRAYIEKVSDVFPEDERLEILEGQRKCLDFWKALMDGDYIHGEKITLKHRLEASVYLAKACGLQDRFVTRKLSGANPRPAVNVNVMNAGGQPTRVELVNPYADADGSEEAGDAD